jgi:ribosome-binding protein aMBF1 (putative translation factor)
MIGADHEYREPLRRLQGSADAIAAEEQKLRSEGLTAEEARRAMAPTRFFHDQIRSEIVSYERLKRREFDELHNLQGLGQLLIGLRISAGLSQRDLAERLGVHESMVSRDERNEYLGITVERANRILEAMQVQIATRVDRVPELAAAS